MKKITLKSVLLGGCLCAMLGGLTAAQNEVPQPTFTKVADPVPGDESQKGEDAEVGSRANQFYHVRDSHAAWGDFNNDGNLDVYYSGRNAHINYWNLANILYINNGDGTFKHYFDEVYNAGKALKGGYFSCPIWFDFNNDGYLDLLIGGGNWQGDGGIDKNNSFAHLFQNMGPNEDGDYVFVEIPDGGGIRKFHNEGSGGKSHQYISVGDYDKDGYIDVVVTGYGRLLEDENETNDARTERMVRLFKNDGGMGFIEQELPLNGTDKFMGMTGGSVVFMDMDADGWLDIVAGGYSDENGGDLHVYWNKGDGTFTENTSQTLEGTYNSGVGVFDFNNDGFMDILITGESPKTCYIYKNNGDRTFDLITKDAAGFEGIDGGQIAFGDVNHDGLEDIFVGGHGEVNEITSFLYLNNGDGTFQKIINPVTRVSHGSQNLIDFDNDGMLDAFVLGWTQNSVCSRECTAELWKNTTANAVNQAPSAPANLSSVYDSDSEMITLNWDASTDDVTPVAAIHYNVYVKKQGDTEAFITVPADINTGFIKVGEISGQVMTNSYSMKIAQDDNVTYEWGVQAIDNGKLGSIFTTSTFKPTVVGIQKNESDNVKVYASNGAIFYNVNETAEITVLDATGKTISIQTVNGSGSINNVSKGFYIITVTTKSGVKAQTVIL